MAAVQGRKSATVNDDVVKTAVDIIVKKVG
jgi:hypothetical protein